MSAKGFRDDIHIVATKDSFHRSYLIKSAFSFSDKNEKVHLVNARFKTAADLAPHTTWENGAG